MLRIVAALLGVGVLSASAIVCLYGCGGRSPQADAPPVPGRHPSGPDIKPLTPEEARDRFAQIVRRISEPLITDHRESVTGLSIGDPKDPEGGPVTVRIAAVHWLSCQCCSSEVADTKFYDKDLDIVLATENIGHLTIHRTRITGRGLRKLPRHTNLSYLDLSHNDLSDACLEHVGKLKGLKVLKLDHTPITGVGLQHLAGLSKLEDLSLNHTVLEDASLRHLAPLARLQRLALEETPITGHGLAALTGLEHLEQLRLGKSGCTDAGLSHLPPLPALVEISLSATAAGDATLCALARSDQLEVIDLSHTAATDAGLAHLSGMKHLRSLNLGQTAVSDSGLAHLSAVTTLQALRFPRTNVRGPGICHLRDCTQLQTLAKSYDPQDHIEADAATLTTLAGFHELRSLSIHLADGAQAAAVDFNDMQHLRRLQIAFRGPVASIRLSNMPALDWLEIRHPGQASFSPLEEAPSMEPGPVVGEIAIRNVGGVEHNSLKLNIAVPQVLRLTNVHKLNRLGLTGAIHPSHAAELAGIEGLFEVNLVCTPGTDPAAVAQLLSALDAHRAGRLKLAVERWDRTWSEALATVHAPYRYAAMHLCGVDADAPIALGGFSGLQELTFSGVRAETLTVQAVTPQARKLALDDVSLGELRLRECCIPLSCRNVHRLDRLVIDGIPPGMDYVLVFADRGRTDGTVQTPKVLELWNVRDLRLCSLRHGHGLQRIQMDDEAEHFSQFQFVPDSVEQMDWAGHEPGAWQGEFSRR